MSKNAITTENEGLGLRGLITAEAITTLKEELKAGYKTKSEKEAILHRIRRLENEVNLESDRYNSDQF